MKVYVFERAGFRLTIMETAFYQAYLYTSFVALFTFFNKWSHMSKMVKKQENNHAKNGVQLIGLDPSWCNNKGVLAPQTKIV